MLDPREIAAALDRTVPFDTACDWDNVGLLLDCGEATDRILVALDATPETVLEAERLGCGVLVSHHPPIFGKIDRLTRDDPVTLAARRGISLIAAHTNWDAAEGGVNTVLAGLLGLRDTRPFGQIGLCGEIDPLEPSELAQKVRERLGTGPLLLVRGPRPVALVGVIGGSSGGAAREAAELGLDGYVTGEVRHSEALAARRLGLTLIAAGHFLTENPAVPALAERLSAMLDGRAECIISRCGADPFESI